MKPSQPKSFESPTAPQVVEQFGRLAKTYTPQWEFDPKNPDAGGALAMIFANQMAENGKLYQDAFHQYHREFVNLLGLSLQPATPARGIVTMGIGADTVDGVAVPKATKLMGDQPDRGGRVLVFETCEDFYVTGSNLTQMLEISQETGKIRYHKGDLARPTRTVSQEDRPYKVTNGAFTPFDFTGETVEENSLFLYHGSLCGVAGERIVIRVSGPDSQKVTTQLADHDRFDWYRYHEGLYHKLEDVSIENGDLTFTTGDNTPLLDQDGLEYGVLAIVAKQPILETLQVTDIRLASCGDNLAPDFCGNNEQEFLGDKLSIFGNQIDLYEDFYVGSDSVFHKVDALVTVSFDLSYKEENIGLAPEDDEFELKVVRKKPQNLLRSLLYRAKVDEIEISYFNGLGWKPVPQLVSYQPLFSGQQDGRVYLTFPCPENWEKLPVASYAGRVLRFRVMRSDNCYMTPCIHTLPVLSNLKLSYHYGDNWMTPSAMERVCGTEMTTVNLATLSRGVDLFSQLPWGGEGLYLGFDKKFENGPINLLFQLSNTNRFTGLTLEVEYSTSNGFSPLKVVDHTVGLRKTGTIQFLPPGDMTALSVEGVTAYWVRILAKDLNLVAYRPALDQVVLNGVEVENVETLDQESFYLEEVAPHMSFLLEADNILNAQVMVNEKRNLTTAEMETLLSQYGDKVQVSYDFLGQIIQFFVQWEEVDDFRNSGPNDRHYVLDRMASTITFGDGVRGKIPKERRDVAFTVTLRRCSGTDGNVNPGTINQAMGSLIYVENIGNPVSTYGGSDLENIPHAYDRGADIVSSRSRLVSRQDYVRCATAFSDRIAKVACLLDTDLTGCRRPGHVLLLLLMADYQLGAPSFPAIQEALLKEMASRSATPEGLEIVQPIFVTISVEVWITLYGTSGAFQVQTEIGDALAQYFSPVSTDTGAKGWEIGVLPQEKMVAMVLNSLKLPGRLSHIIAVAEYSDQTGTHQCSLDDLPNHGVFICQNGTHRVHVQLPKKGGLYATSES